MIKTIFGKLVNGIKALIIGALKALIVFFVDVLFLGLTSILCSWWYGVSVGYLIVSSISFTILTVELFMIGALITVLMINVDKKLMKFIDKNLGKKSEDK